MRAQAVSVGHRIDADAPGAGCVHSVFAHAVNLALGGELWTLLGADRPDLPFGIRVASPGFDPPGLRRGDAVHVRSGLVGVGAADRGLVVDCRAAPRWIPDRPSRLAAGLAERLDVVAAAGHRAWHGSAAMAAAVAAALNDEDALGLALSRVIGRGPGSTPAGDDVVIGILAVLASPLAGPAGVDAVCSLRSAMAPLLPGTTDISAHLLRQASHGWFSRGVHELIAALIEHSPTPVLRARVRRVVESGATSGADLCTGLLACARALLVTLDERVAA
jgi:Protein of unknown function (DUF2877)